jgi:hypothetical protein
MRAGSNVRPSFKAPEARFTCHILPFNRPEKAFIQVNILSQTKCPNRQKSGKNGSFVFWPRD